MRYAGVGLGPVDMAFGFPVRSAAKGIGGIVIMTSSGAVQVLRVSMSGNHIRGARIPRCLGVAIGEAAVLSRKHAAGLGVGATALHIASLQIEVSLLGCGLAISETTRKTPNSKVHWSARRVGLVEPQHFADQTANCV
jgi:hypothetical protein